jgi:hypothetical protein
VPNAAVRFDVGSGTGPGGTFAGGARSETELTNSDGVATSSPLVANSTAGAWSAKASVGALSTRFPLYNDLRTTTAVSSSANPSVPGQSVRFRAKVTTAPGAGTPTGTVQFSVDGSNLGGAVPLDDGVATSPSTAALTPGGHTVKASYSGSPGYGPASGVLTQIVKATIPVACDPSSLTFDVAAAPPHAVLSLSPGCVYTLTGPANPPAWGNGLLITKPVSIEGNGATITRSTTAGTPAFRLFGVESSGRLTINNLTLTNGDSPGTSGGGGAIFDSGPPTRLLAEERRAQPLPLGITPHKLRHTFASILVAIGTDPTYVMQQLGHTDPAFTLPVYAHVMRRSHREREALKALVEGRVLAGKRQGTPDPAHHCARRDRS